MTVNTEQCTDWRRQLSKTAIGTKHKKFGHLPGEIHTVEQMIEGVKRSGKDSGFELEDKN